MLLQKTGRPPPRVNLSSFSVKDVLELENLLLDTPLKRRAEIPGVDPQRADLLLPATIVLRSIMERLDLDELTVSDKAIREGLLYDFIERHPDRIQAEQEIPHIRRRNVMYLAPRCQYEDVQSQHRSKLRP